MKIEWTQTECGTWRGIDENSNVYLTPANRETCSVQTVDGYSGYGWTPEEALSRAKSVPPAPCLLDAAKAMVYFHQTGKISDAAIRLMECAKVASHAELLSAAIAAEETRLITKAAADEWTTMDDSDRDRMNADAARMITRIAELEAENAELRAVCKRALVWLAKAECEGINANCAMPCDLPECQNQIEAILAKKESE